MNWLTSFSITWRKQKQKATRDYQHAIIQDGNRQENDECEQMMILSDLLLELLNKEETFRSHPLARNQHNRHNAHKHALCPSLQNKNDDADVDTAKVNQNRSMVQFWSTQDKILLIEHFPVTRKVSASHTNRKNIEAESRTFQISKSKVRLWTSHQKSIGDFFVQASPSSI